MDYFMWNVDEYQPLEGCNKFAPTWPFRMATVGSSDSGKTTMNMNLLMGNKKMKEDGKRYIPCNDIVLIGKHLNEPKWKIVEDFYNELAEEGEDVSFKSYNPEDMPAVSDFDPARSTIVIFEDLLNESKKIQDSIASYFTHGRHNNISSIYVAQRFFKIPKTIRENLTYISLHRGGGSLSDIKRIISQYTEHSDSLAPIIDDLTLKKEFIVFDLLRSRSDPLSIRVRWDTSLRLILDKSQIEPGSILDKSQIETRSINNTSSSELSSKFSSYGQNAIALAKKNGSLIEFARKMPVPKERSLLLAEGVNVKNNDIWARYVFREAYGIVGKDLGSEWQDFVKKIKNEFVSSSSKNSQYLRYKKILELRPLDDKKFIEGCEILLWLFSNSHIDRHTFLVGIKELSTSL